MKSDDYYLSGSSEWNAKGTELRSHALIGDITVYREQNTASTTGVLCAGSCIFLHGCDNVEWLRIMSDNGASYWLHVANGMVDTPNGLRPIGEIVEGLN